MKKALVFILLLAVCSCSKPKSMHGKNPQDINGFLNFNTYKPIAVEYELEQLGDGNLGPSDYKLEALLYYDEATFIKLRDEYANTVHTTQDKSSKYFNFIWLPKAVKNELAKSPKAYTGHPGVILSSNPNCTLWFLKNKVLVYYFTM